MTWLEVVDSAVKIGLGALIAGISSLLLSRSQHRRELDRAKIDREFNILKDVAEQTERFTQTALRYWSLIGESHRLRRKSSSLSAKKESNLEETKRQLFDIFHELTSAEAKLLLLGKRDAQGALRSYGDIVNAFRRSVVTNTEIMTDVEIEAWRENILRSRERVFSELHRCYQQLGP
jgi:hypothetical protein